MLKIHELAVMSCMNYKKHELNSFYKEFKTVIEHNGNEKLTTLQIVLKGDKAPVSKTAHIGCYCDVVLECRDSDDHNKNITMKMSLHVHQLTLNQVIILFVLFVTTVVHHLFKTGFKVINLKIVCMLNT